MFNVPSLTLNNKTTNKQSYVIIDNIIRLVMEPNSNITQ